MQKYNLKINKKVYEFLEELNIYIFDKTKSIQLSEKVTNSILKEMNFLKDFPYSYPEFNKRYRYMIINKKYIIFYKINEKQKKVTIHRIYSTSQNYLKYFKKQ